jgi:GT2 family glycosyltransferase
MKLSVFIPTYNGRAKLAKLLPALQRQTDTAFDVHVLVDGSTDDTRTLEAEFPQYAFHFYSNAGRAGIRNRALEISSEGIFLFLDHDMLPERDLVAKHKAFHLKNPGSVLVGNGFRNPDDARSTFGHYLVEAERNWIRSHAAAFRITANEFVFTACNLSIPAALFHSLHGFNTALKDGEDFEFGMRALTAGVPLYYDRNVTAWHDDWPTLDQYINRNSEYLAGKKVLVNMNPEFERLLKVNAGARSHNRFKQFLQSILGGAAMSNSLLFRMLPLKLKFIAYKSAIYQFSKA